MHRDVLPEVQVSTREKRRARIAARRERVAARRLRVQARREEAAARRAKTVEDFELIATQAEAETRRAGIAERRARRVRRQLRPGLRRREYVTTEVGAPPKDVAWTHFGRAIIDKDTGQKSIEFRRTEKVESSWVHSIHLVWIRVLDEVRLGVTFLDGYTCVYDGSGPTDFLAMLAAPSKGKHIWAHWYGVDRRVISAYTKAHLAGLGIPV